LAGTDWRALTDRDGRERDLPRAGRLAVLAWRDRPGTHRM